MLMGLHLVVVVLRAGVLVLHGSTCCTHGRLLGRCLDMRVLPGSGGPLLLGFGHAGPTATVEVMNLKVRRSLSSAERFVYGGVYFMFLEHSDISYIIMTWKQ